LACPIWWIRTISVPQLLDEYSTFMSRRDRAGRLIGAPSMVLPTGVTSWPAIGPFGLTEETEVWPGVGFTAAAIYYSAGARFADPALEQDGIKMAAAVAAQIWDVPSNGFRFDAPEAWHEDTTSLYRYPAYAQSLAVWDLLDAIQPIKA
jgi:non-lysosomal glucosylceramidase